ncbi:MAG: hypothetical protein RIR68_2866 [Pseudomonadota bacterium]
MQIGGDDSFIFRVATQIVDARQVNQLRHLIAHQQSSRQQGHREARPVTYFGMRTCEAVEQSGFARVGHANQNNLFHEDQGLLAGDAESSIMGTATMRFASFKRMITSVVPTRTCTGPPKSAFRRTWTLDPALKPKAAKRCFKSGSA